MTVAHRSSASGTTCPVCGGSLGDGATRRCAECGFAATIDSLGILTPLGVDHSQPNDEVAYPEEGAAQTLAIEDASFWFAHRNQVIAAILERHQPAGTIWDIGAGNGFQARFLQSTGRKAVCVEPGLVGCRNAVARDVEVVIHATLQQIALPDAAIPAISLFDVVEHIAAPEELLAECKRVLAPGGLAYITVPAFPWLWSDEDVYARHCQRFTRKSLTALLEGVGFEVLMANYYFKMLLLPVCMFRTLPYRLLPWSDAHHGDTMDPDDHTPNPVARRAADAILGRELSAIRRGVWPRFGTSIAAVARRAR